jgi:hypothetical protein
MVLRKIENKPFVISLLKLLAMIGSKLTKQLKQDSQNLPISISL